MTGMNRLYLASQSPRRLELMRQIGLAPEVLPVAVDESALPNEPVESFVRRLAVEKARAGFDRLPDKKVWVVGGDTVVSVDGQVLGKPRDQADYRRMLALLSGRIHQVLTAVAVVHDGVVQATVSISQVTFAELDASEIDAYWRSGEPRDKAGGYGIQGYAGKWVRHLQGSYSGIMGLPLYELDQLLKESGYYG